MESTSRNGGSQQNEPNVTQRQGSYGAQERGEGSARAQGTASSRSPRNRGVQRARGAHDLATGGQQAYNPLTTMLQLSRQMDRLMDSFFGRSFGSPLLSSRLAADEGAQSLALWEPKIDIQQRGDTLVVCADLPGVRKEDVNIDVSDEGLTISGQRQEEREEGGDEQGYRMVERSYGSFYRTIPLPEGAKSDQAKANIRDGVLRIEVPLEKSSRRRQIQIEG